MSLLVIGIPVASAAAVVAHTCADPLDISGTTPMPGLLAAIKDRDEIAYPAHSALGALLQAFSCEPSAVGLQWLKAAAHARSTTEIERTAGGLSAALRLSLSPVELERQLCRYVSMGFARAQQAAAAAAAGLQCAPSRPLNG